MSISTRYPGPINSILNFFINISNSSGVAAANTSNCFPSNTWDLFPFQIITFPKDPDFSKILYHSRSFNWGHFLTFDETFFNSVSVYLHTSTARCLKLFAFSFEKFRSFRDFRLESNFYWKSLIFLFFSESGFSCGLGSIFLSFWILARFQGYHWAGIRWFINFLL
jgi:hypothetical protein